MVYADSLTAVSADATVSVMSSPSRCSRRFRKAFKIVADLPCDILMTPHPGASDLFARLGPGATHALVDPGACVRYAAEASKTLDARLAKETPKAAP